jgi:hypothetical protein
MIWICKKKFIDPTRMGTKKNDLTRIFTNEDE